MSTTKPKNVLKPDTKTNKEPTRNLANFPPPIWGDRFLSFSLDYSELEAYGKRMEEPREKVRKLILEINEKKEKLSLIYSVYRLGLSYIFSEAIDDELHKLFNAHPEEEEDLYTTSIHFQVFRIFGYPLSCDVFNKFTDSSLEGGFKEEITRDVRGMISFYESSQLRINGESILDEANAFTESRLKTLEIPVDAAAAGRLKQAMERPFNRGHPMVEARHYLLNYEEEISRYDSLLMLAKLHFNYLQLLQKEELRTVSKWWIESGLQKNTPYVRDRVPELYVWMLAFFLEPHYSQARIIATKIVVLVLVLDDTYDAYSTIEESRLLTQAIDRWDMGAISQLPEYIKPFYKILLDEYAGFYEHLDPPQQGTTNAIEASKKAFQELARGYHQEGEWRHSGEMPSFEDYMKIGLVTSTHDVLCKSALIGMGNIVTQEALAWYQSHPKIIIDVQLIGRLEDDVVSVEFERERAPTATSVDTYMKSFGVSEDVAIKALKKQVETAWKDVHEACLKPTEVPMDLLATIVNLARMTDVAYRYNDGFTFPEKTLKEYITLLFCVSIPM